MSCDCVEDLELLSLHVLVAIERSASMNHEDDGKPSLCAWQAKCAFEPAVSCVHVDVAFDHVRSSEAHHGTRAFGRHEAGEVEKGDVGRRILLHENAARSWSGRSVLPRPLQTDTPREHISKPERAILSAHELRTRIRGMAQRLQIPPAS